MDQLVRRVSEHLAAQPSRRGILATVTKLGIGAGTILADLRRQGDAAAQGDYCQVAGSCCLGSCDETAQLACADSANTGKCPNGYKKRYQWFCNNNGTRELCLDCYNSQRKYGCTVVTTR